jgi:hypothetical protein
LYQILLQLALKSILSLLKDFAYVDGSVQDIMKLNIGEDTGVRGRSKQCNSTEPEVLQQDGAKIPYRSVIASTRSSTKETLISFDSTPAPLSLDIKEFYYPSLNERLEERWQLDSRDLLKSS